MEGANTGKVLAWLVAAVIVSILIIWFMSKKETLIDPTINFKIGRGYNVSNGNGYLVAVRDLAQVEHSKIGSFDNPAVAFM